MRTVPESLTIMIRNPVENLGYELVGMELTDRGTGGKLLRIYIDSEDGITLDDCSKVSHQVGGILDVEDPIRGNYSLEVSSPGLDRPLFYKEHFEKFKNKKAKIKMSSPYEGRRKFTGILDGVDGEFVLVVEDGEHYRLPYDQIDSARLVAEF